MSSGADLTTPGVQGRRTRADAVMGRYVARVQRAAATDASVAQVDGAVDEWLTVGAGWPGMELEALEGFDERLATLGESIEGFWPSADESLLSVEESL